EAEPCDRDPPALSAALEQLGERPVHGAAERGRDRLVDLAPEELREVLDRKDIGPELGGAAGSCRPARRFGWDTASSGATNGTPRCHSRTARQRLLGHPEGDPRDFLRWNDLTDSFAADAASHRSSHCASRARAAARPGPERTHFPRS